MKTIIIAALLATTALPAFATDKKPSPAPTQGQVQGQAQGQIQAQGQLQGQQQRAISSAQGGSAVSGGGGGGQGGAGGAQSQNQDVTVNNNGNGSNNGGNGWNGNQFPVASAVAPSFAIGSCQWAMSGGIQFFGTGVSGGGAGMYEFCKVLMKSKHMTEAGNRDVAKALECQDSSIRAAYKSVGQPCLEDAPRQVAAAQPVVPVLAAQALPQNCTTKTVGGKSFVTCE